LVKYLDPLVASSKVSITVDMREWLDHRSSDGVDGPIVVADAPRLSAESQADPSGLRANITAAACPGLAESRRVAQPAQLTTR
jgi:hypothetical protein